MNRKKNQFSVTNEITSKYYTSRWKRLFDNVTKNTIYFWVLCSLIIPFSLQGKVSVKDSADINGVLKYPVHVFCGTGDNLWTYDKEPVDSPEAVDAMFDWMSQTYKVKRMYWRGGQEDMWRHHFQMGERSVKVEVDDYTANWADFVYGKLKVNEAAVKAAKRTGMEIFLYTGLFEFGVQPDVGVIVPHLFEDKLRIDHPEWTPLDRWGERRSPGPVAFCYPEVRKIVVKRLVDQMVKDNYDGINFYTYVENVGLRYLDEFGFNQPIVDEFNKRYPGTDLRKDKLSQEQRLYWYECRGKFVTDFIRELKQAMTPHGKKLSMILDAENPDYVQPWWGRSMPGTGMIHLNWKDWVKEGLVDEFWVQLGPFEGQKKVLDSLLKVCKGKPVKLTVRTPDPYAPHWGPYVAAGVTPIAVITWLNNGIEKYSFEPINKQSFLSKDWKVRLQALSDIINGKLKAEWSDVARLAKDSNVLVRRKAMLSLAAIKEVAGVPILEEGLLDMESSVCTAAAVALKSIHGPQSGMKLLAALERRADFPFKNAVTETLHLIGPEILPNLYKALLNSSVAVREVAVRAITDIGIANFQPQAFDELLKVLNDGTEDYRVRWWAIKGVQGLLDKVSVEQKGQVWTSLLHLLSGPENSALQLQAALTIGQSVRYLETDYSEKSMETLSSFFKQYGDGCNRKDAAYGWRLAGNALKAFGVQGVNILEDFRKQKDDKWLAWNAYEVLYLAQTEKPSTIDGGFSLVSEEQAIREHEMYAPAFPGWRKW